MITVPVTASREYKVHIQRGLLDSVGNEIRRICRADNAVVVSGPNVWKHYGERVCTSLRKAGLNVYVFLTEAGETSKSIETYGRLVQFLSTRQVTRSDVLVALGGGVTGDLTGFAAATYLRGIDYIQVPTTLLAMVDSSIGGKTALNLQTGKNQVGAFYQPAAVLCDPETLRTLPEEEYRGGTAEVLKYGVLGNEHFFEELVQTPVREQEEHVIETCVKMKRNVIARDEYDRGDRRLLNFGHTFGHAIEACSGFSILHGLAVATGMAMITRASAAKGICDMRTEERLISALRQYGLPTETHYPCEQLSASAGGDKKRLGGTLSLVVPVQIGNCRILSVPMEEIPQWITLGGAP